MLEVNAGALAEVAHWVLPAVPAKPTNPAMTAITLRADGERLTLGAWDYELQVSAEVECSGELHIHVPARTFVDMLDRLSGTAKIEPVGTRLAITDGRRRFQLAVMAQDSYPPVPPEVKSLGQAHGFAAAFAKAAVSTDRDNPLPALRSVHLEATGQWLILRATDRYTLGRLAIPWRGEPFSAFALASKVGPAVKTWTGLIDIGRDDNRVGIAHAGRDLAVNEVAVPADEVPHYDRVLKPFEAGVPCVVTVNRAALLDAVKAITVVTPPLKPVLIKHVGPGVMLTSVGDDLGAGEVPVDADVEGDLPARLGYSAQYLAESLSVFDTELLRIRIIDARRPALLVALDGEMNEVVTHQHLLMPIGS